MKNLIKHNLKQKIWLTGCISLLFILCRPMLQLVTYENESRFALTKESLIETMERTFLPDVYSDYVPTVIACVVIALVLFSYLFSKRKVDLYHSIPVDRKHLFLATYLSGICIYLIALVLEYFLCIFLALPNHYFTVSSLSNIIVGISINIIHFLFGYSFVICAVMLSGNIIVALAGTAVLGLIFPAIFTLFEYFKSYFYVTHLTFSRIDLALLEKYSFMSPLVSYARIISRTKYSWNDNYYEKATMVYPDLILPILMTVAMTFLGYFLYMKRPSEAAGKAIAFKKTRAYIEIPLVILGGMIGAWFMCTSINTYKISWVWFGIVLGAVLIHFILEAILNESFKSILSHKLQLLASVAVSLVIILVFYNDLTKFDTYIPDRDKIESVGICFYDVDNDISNLIVKKDPNSGFYNVTYEDQQYTGLNAGLTEKTAIDKVIGLQQIGVSSVEEMISDKKEDNENQYYDYNYERAAEEKIIYEDDLSTRNSAFSDEEAYSQALKWMEENGISKVKEDEIIKVSFGVNIKLKNGKKILRYYRVPLAKAYEAMNSVYSSSEYIEKHFSLINEKDSDAIYKVEVFDGYGNKVVSLTEADKDLLLDTYTEELKKMNFDIISNSPIGRLAPCVKVSEVYDETYSGYYLYPEFTKTLALIESYGVDMSVFTNEIKPDELMSVNISSYGLYGYNKNDTLYVENLTYDKEYDEDYLKELAPKLIISNYVWSNQTLISNKTGYSSLGVDATANLTPIKGIQRNFSVMFKDGKVPEKVEKDIIIRLWEENNY